nr:unnamed protein product [Spirometra erinaceieuropaei]
MQVSREQKRALQVLIDGVEKWYAEWRKLRPHNVGPLYYLTELNLARTGLRVLPSSGILGALPRLQVLNLQDNSISSLNGALWRYEETPTLAAVFFAEPIVQKALINLEKSASPGLDAMPAKLLKELAPEVSKTLALIFQTSFFTECLPSDWKSVTITPHFKGESRASANDYRPVSLTSICCKIMEKIIKKALMQFLEQHHLLSDAQHGFRGGKSCLTNLLFTLERWTKACDEGNVMHAIYIDFKKAFDNAPHQRHLQKLRNAGIRGRPLVRIQSFLTGRSERVKVRRQQFSYELLSEFHALHFVEELNFAGNPLAYEPFYRETILARFPRLVKFDDVAVYAITGRRRPVREKTKYEPRRKSKSLLPRRVKQKAPRVSERSQAVQTPKSCLRKLADLQEAEFPVAKVDETWEIHSQ